jgi:hypothetical protein
MDTYRVALAFDDEDDREPFMERLRSFNLPAGEELVEEEGQDPELHIGSASAESALARAHVLRQGAVDGTDIDPRRIRLGTQGFAKATVAKAEDQPRDLRSRAEGRHIG